MTHKFQLFIFINKQCKIIKYIKYDKILYIVNNKKLHITLITVYVLLHPSVFV